MSSLELNLSVGWNLISIPLELENNSVNSVFKAVNYSYLFFYDKGWYVPTEINYSRGYWMRVDDPVNLTINGRKIADTSININPGWNLVSYPYLNEKNVSQLFWNKIVYSLDGIWSSYIPNRTSNSLTILKPGYGYWIK